MFLAFLLTTDQPARSSYQPMTIIAYLHDCHCRYDERSIVQKKKHTQSLDGPGSGSVTILRRSGRRQMPIGGCSSRWASRIAISVCLTGTIKANWIQLPVERYLTALPTLKQGVIAGVFKNKGAAPWAITRAEKLQLSDFLPNDLSLDDWYAGVYALPTVWPDVSMLGANNLRRVVGYDFHHLRKKYDVLSMWGNIHPQWRLLQQHLETKGPGWYPLSEREERLFTNRSNRPGDDMKDELRTDGDPIAWRGLEYCTEPTTAVTPGSSTLSFLVNKACLLTCMPKFERKNKSYLLNAPVVSKMYP